MSAIFRKIYLSQSRINTNERISDFSGQSRLSVGDAGDQFNADEHESVGYLVASQIRSPFAHATA